MRRLCVYREGEGRPGISSISETAEWLSARERMHLMSVAKKKPTDSDAEMIVAIRAGLPAGVELDEREEAILDLAARQASDVAVLEADIAARGHLVEGSRGQLVLNPSIAEARQGRLALGKLLGQLDLPDVVRNARRAAEARWAS
jgi:uncharacterized protein with von Willebrand factor type A (vWA) domain